MLAFLTANSLYSSMDPTFAIRYQKSQYIQVHKPFIFGTFFAG